MSDINAPDALNIIVADRFKIVRPIGQGSFGEVYQGIDLIAGSKVAIKLEEVAQPVNK